MATTPFAYRFHSAIHTVHIVLLALQVVSVGLRLRELPTAETVIPAVETAVLALVAAAGGRLRYVAAPARAPHPARRRAYLFYVAIGTVYGLLNAATSVAVMVFAPPPPRRRLGPRRVPLFFFVRATPTAGCARLGGRGRGRGGARAWGVAGRTLRP